MVTPVADIVVNQKYVFRGCHSFSIRRDVDELSATGTVVLPLSAVIHIFYFPSEGRHALRIFTTPENSNGFGRD
jgi:hypothetical protein